MQEWFLDIKGILSSKFENNVISFGAKMLVKWPLIPIIVQRNDTQKAARVKRQGKTKAKGEKEIWNGNRKSKTKKCQTFAYAHAPN